ncbi:4-hydroxy-tetrahydrodipicolinate reductase 2, chloroplastic [Dendrobium catenatum]|uniref:4-hydroxy-tetrahydrodipicolinate reductase 2, chloroplastic n=1 Tax=Dendrobium catenatum TaxID=906689 RepID=A0A2I0V995_9ASPA|nr:4-hydroxy-tetrahydrodipicolinate reductase 2, chloroplastic [Dendrobium catenatum]
MYHLTSPNKIVSFEFQHNVYGHSIYVEDTIDAAIFFFMKIKSKIPNILNILEPISSRRMNFEEFCAAAISPYHSEALEEWEQMNDIKNI